ncbi:MAG: acyl-ACP thioesterase domain-containing protein [Lentisphaeria bacterium]
MEDFSAQFEVRYSEADRNNHLKLHALFDYAQEIAGRQTYKHGMDTIQLHPKNQGWILSRIKFKITRYPGIHEKITVHTYSSGYDRLFALREYHYLDEENNEFAIASSDWLLLDVQKLKILNIKKELGETFPYDSDASIAFPDLKKLPRMPFNPDLAFPYKVHESMLDINNHLNNTEYAGFVQNFLGEKRYATELQINFQASVPKDGIIHVQGTTNGNCYQVAGFYNDKLSFQAAGVFTTIN